MVQASAEKGLDFSSADFRDRYWWLKVRWCLDRLEDVQTLELLKAQHNQHLSVLDYSLEKTAFDKHWNEANKILQTIYSLNFPWAAKHKDYSRSSEIDTLLAQWRAKYGDYKDPEVRARFDKIAEAIKAHHQKGRDKYFQKQQDEKNRRRAFKNRKKKK